MTIRKLFPLLLVAVAAVVLMPEAASAQCWWCGGCNWESDEDWAPSSCHGRTQGSPMGYTNCHEDAPCSCRIWLAGWGVCLPWKFETAAAETEQLKETLAAIRAGRSISADGPFVYLRQGADYVVRRRCDASEMARVAVADIRPVPIVAAG